MNKVEYIFVIKFNKSMFLNWHRKKEYHEINNLIIELYSPLTSSSSGAGERAELELNLSTRKLVYVGNIT